MVGISTGIGYLIDQFSPQDNSSGGISDIKIIPARVIDIVMDESHPKFKEYGSWTGIFIFFV